MPEAVIVSTARTPIGRAVKGSLKDLRADDLAAHAVLAALAKIPELDPTQIDDLHARCRPTGRRIRKQPGPSRSRWPATRSTPGVTVNRYCSSSCRQPVWHCTPYVLAKVTYSSLPV